MLRLSADGGVTNEIIQVMHGSAVYFLVSCGRLKSQLNGVQGGGLSKRKMNSCGVCYQFRISRWNFG
jgi:hypothetical protein